MIRVGSWKAHFQNSYTTYLLVIARILYPELARENSKSYGRISVLTQARFNIKKLLIAPSDIFKPKPKVDGMVLEFSPIKKYNNIDINKLETILRKAFSLRRKKIKSSLKDYKNILESNNFDLNHRAENISVEDYCRLSNLI